MGEHSSLRLLRKLVRIISFLLLWQFDCGAVGQKSPYMSSYCVPIEREVVPCEEVVALQTVLYTLGLSLTSNFWTQYCNDTMFPDFKVTCNCTFGCHITEITVNGKPGGYIHEDVSELRFLEQLDLDRLGLYGTIPSSMGNLSNLIILKLNNNQLTGSIPNSLGILKNLTYLDLSNNQLSGTIPISLGDLSMLTHLYLEYNQLTGPIPENLKKLQSLTTLYLYRNFLTRKIPKSLGELSSLQNLILSFNKLEGQIPYELGNLTELEELDLRENLLSGRLPEELGKLSNLQYLKLSSNNINDELPQNYSGLKSLLIFDVAANNLSGQIPKYIKDWINLVGLNLLGNNFEGGLPIEILKMTTLEYLYVSDLSISSFSIKNANLTGIFSLTLRNCAINGPIPPNIWKWKWLSNLDLSFNNLTGKIPMSLGDRSTTIRKMYLTGNMLNGRVPGWINLTRASDLSYNNFTNGTWAEEKKKKKNRLNNYTNVTSQLINIVPNGNFISEMSDDNCQDGKSKYHSLFINSGGEEESINKNIYEADTSLSNFYASDKGNWAYTCSGDFLSSSYNSSSYIQNLTCGASVRDQPLYDKARLCPVSLTYYGFCLRKGSYTVKLHFAEIVYTKNEDYSSLGKRVFDVYVQGKRELKDFNIKEKTGGPNEVWVENITAQVKKDNLLTIHFFWAGKGSTDNPPLLNGPLISAISVTPNFKVGGLSDWKIAVISVASILAPVLLLALLWRMGLVGDRELRESRVKLQGKSYTLKQIIDGTRKFSPKMEIGKGHFGIVYKAELPADQVVAAVKKLYPELMQKEGNEIRNEIFTLKSLEHENLVQLMDGYSKNDLHLLIYEYMEHGSLEQALFGPSPLALDWKARFEICKGIAKGLKYLHEETRFNIIHGNIKATNILLDGTPNPTAKLSDFGLAKFHDEENPFLVNKARRTLTYMAPEYALQKPITVKADVYSFGVVLLEIVSGKPNAEYKDDKETVFLLDKASGLHAKGRLLELIDGKLSNDYNRKEANILLNLAMICINQFPDRRPKMSEVVSVLAYEKDIEQISNVATPSAT